MFLLKRRLSLLITTAAIVLSVVAPGTSHAQTAERCFNVPGITNCIRGRFLQYWQENGGLPVFGYPVTPELQERTPEGSFTVQYFERNRFELHPEKPRPYDILLGRLGDARLRQLERVWSAETQGKPEDECSWWPQTRHAICGIFKEYWEGHGLNDPRLDRMNRSLQLFGLPLTEPRMETNSSGDTVLTQWFERARFEYHPFDGILLGLLGHEVRRNPPPAGDELDIVIVDVDQFWSRALPGQGWTYFSPDAVIEYNRPIRTGCGPANPSETGPFYCRLDYSIYLELGTLSDELQYVGDMAIVTIVSHEWGHHIQNLLGVTTDDYYSIQIELQADCYAGAYARDADARGLLEQGDIDEALTSLSNAGDPIDTAWDDPLAHGTGEQRTASFLKGLRAGVQACSQS